MASTNKIAGQPAGKKAAAPTDRMKIGQEPKRDAAGTVKTEYNSVRVDGSGLAK